MKDAVALAACLCPAIAAAQTAPLNDTGQTSCFNGVYYTTCTANNNGSAAANPGQDGRFGRDAAQGAGQLPKIGSGAAGFDFTALDASGQAIAPGAHSCVRDNVTGLMWEVKQRTSSAQLRHSSHTFTYHNGTNGTVGGNTCNGTLPGNQCNTGAYVAAVNAAGLCGHRNWRVPTRRELLSIVHRGTFGNTVDGTYFPDVSRGGSWWSSDVYALGAANIWIVDFNDGHTTAAATINPINVRLVRRAP